MASFHFAASVFMLLSTRLFDLAWFDKTNHFRDLTGAHVHLIGISEPHYCALSSKDVADWGKLVEPLLRQESAPAKRVWALLDKDARDSCKHADIIEGGNVARADDLRFKVLRALRGILGNPEFHSEEVFKEMKLPPDVTTHVKKGKQRTLVESMRLNRKLLSMIFPGAFVAPQDEYHGVSVKVAEGQKVILVFASYYACRWTVEVHKNAEVVGVILVGHFTQEVEGLNAPIIYRANHGPDGKSTGAQSLEAHSEKHKNYRPLLEMISDLTGKVPSSFQGVYKAPKDGFRVPAR